jgi:hypothetical protein
MAEARARQDIAFQQRALVKAEITDYSKNVTTGRAGSGQNAAEDYIVGQQSINMELYPVKVEFREKIDGAWWVVVSSLKIPEPIIIPSETPYVESGMEAVQRMNERLERNRLKAPVVNEARNGVGSEAISEMVSE